jgi:thioredoxin-dependent adenylylsulfate APS reductase
LAGAYRVARALPREPVATADREDIRYWAEQLEHRSAEEVLAWALARFGRERLALVASFQAESSVLIDMAWRLEPRVRVVTIDTGRLPEETHAFIERVRERYGLAVEVAMPDPELVGRMVARYGPNLFTREPGLRLLCCHVRKVLPLAGVLAGLDAWVTGLRRQQAASRVGVRKVELDPLHGGVVKLSPLADWSDEQVWAYIRARGLPYHPLYDRGYASIGCAPCTRPVAPGADPRSGRWWWEQGVPKECGMHCALESGTLARRIEELLGGAVGSGEGGAAEERTPRPEVRAKVGPPQPGTA